MLFWLCCALAGNKCLFLLLFFRNQEEVQRTSERHETLRCICWIRNFCSVRFSLSQLIPGFIDFPIRKQFVIAASREWVQSVGWPTVSAVKRLGKRAKSIKQKICIKKLSGTTFAALITAQNGEDKKVWIAFLNPPKISSPKLFWTSQFYFYFDHIRELFSHHRTSSSS